MQKNQTQQKFEIMSQQLIDLHDKLFKTQDKASYIKKILLALQKFIYLKLHNQFLEFDENTDIILIIIDCVYYSNIYSSGMSVFFFDCLSSLIFNLKCDYEFENLFLTNGFKKLWVSFKQFLNCEESANQFSYMILQLLKKTDKMYLFMFLQPLVQQILFEQELSNEHFYSNQKMIYVFLLKSKQQQIQAYRTTQVFLEISFYFLKWVPKIMKIIALKLHYHNEHTIQQNIAQISEEFEMIDEIVSHFQNRIFYQNFKGKIYRVIFDAILNNIKKQHIECQLIASLIIVLSIYESKNTCKTFYRLFIQYSLQKLFYQQKMQINCQNLSIILIYLFLFIFQKYTLLLENCQAIQEQLHDILIQKLDLNQIYYIFQIEVINNLVQDKNNSSIYNELLYQFIEYLNSLQNSNKNFKEFFKGVISYNKKINNTTYLDHNLNCVFSIESKGQLFRHLFNQEILKTFIQDNFQVIHLNKLDKEQIELISLQNNYIKVYNNNNANRSIEYFMNSQSAFDVFIFDLILRLENNILYFTDNQHNTKHQLILKNQFQAAQLQELILNTIDLQFDELKTSLKEVINILQKKL